jgi:hypothetical protein
MEFFENKLHLNLELKILKFIEFSQRNSKISPKISHVFLFRLSFGQVVGAVAVVMLCPVGQNFAVDLVVFMITD